MASFILCGIFALVIFNVVTVNAHIVESQIEFLVDFDHSTGDGLSLTDSRPVAPKLINSAKKLCVTGSWALYSEINYGRAAVSTVVANAVSGYAPIDCTSDRSGAIEAVLKNVKSVRLLGKSPLELFPYKYFITDDPEPKTALNEIPITGIKSFVLADQENDYLACNAAKICVCLRKAKGPFIVDDLAYFPKGNALGDLDRFEDTNTPGRAKECNSYPEPWQ